MTKKLSRAAKPWTQPEVIFLHKNYKELSAKEIGAYLKRTPKAISDKCRKLRLIKKQTEPPEKIVVYLPPKEKARIDRWRGSTTRSTFVRLALKEFLDAKASR